MRFIPSSEHTKLTAKSAKCALDITKTGLFVIILKSVELEYPTMLFFSKISIFFQQHLKPHDPSSTVLPDFSGKTSFTCFNPNNVYHKHSEETLDPHPPHDSSSASRP